MKCVNIKNIISFVLSDENIELSYLLSKKVFCADTPLYV